MTDETPEPAARLKPRQPPPPLTRSVHGPLLPHAAVLDELASPAGVLLWRLLQDTTLWSAAEASGREGLFADEARAAAGLVPEVEEELDALGVLVRDPHPDAAPLIARMCDRVRAWAEGRGLRGTALAFAQAAALADPADARCAYEVGRLARGRAEYARAEVWYQRAVVLARRSGDAEAWALGLSGLANMHAQRGNYPLARRLKLASARLARRNSLTEVLGGVYHDLAVLDFETGDVQAGMRNARRGLRILGIMHDRTPVLVHDMAVALMDRCGAFAEADELLRAVLPHVRQQEMRLLTVANIGRAAGATGDVRTFEAAWTDAWAVLQKSADALCTDQLIALARGAVSIRQWERARLAGERALALAEERKEGKSIYLAEALLGALGSEHHATLAARPASLPTEDPAVRAFVDELVSTMRVRPPQIDGVVAELLATFDDPGNARKAYALGRALRSAAEYDRGAEWFKQGIRLAQESGDAAGEALCLGGLGNLYLQSGNLPLASAAHRRRATFAQQNGLSELEADALVDLCSISFMQGNEQDGYSSANRVLALLGPGHRLFHRLAHDLAMHLMEQHGDFQNALLLLQALRRCNFPQAVRLVIEASLARAAAGTGDAKVFEEAWSGVWSEIEMQADSEYLSGTLVQLAQAALIRGHADLAERAACQALAVATRRGEAQIAAGAKTLLSEAAAAAATRVRTPPRMDPAHDRRAASRLARGIATALRGGTPRTRRSAPAAAPSSRQPGIEEA